MENTTAVVTMASDWEKRPRSIRLDVNGWKLDVWQVAGEGWKFTANHDGIYTACGTRPTKEAACEAALDHMKRTVQSLVMEQQILNQATYAKADGMAGERSLTYGINAKGHHVVRIDLPAGEDIGPCIFRYATAEEAGRKCGETLRKWGAAGYIPAEEYWAALRQKVGA